MGVVTRSKSKRRRLEEEAEAGGGEQDDVDLISRLPDDVLGDVITLLPAEDGARTQILSRRWRPLWRSAPLNLEATIHPARLGVKENPAAAILGAHGAPARRLSLTWLGRSDEAPALDNLLRSPSLDNLRELGLRYGTVVFSARPYKAPPPPPSMFRFSPTLRVLSVFARACNLDFPRIDADFPHLEQVTLRSVIIAESTLHGMLSRCPALQSLMLHYNVGYRRLRISSSTLRSLGVTATGSKDPMGKLEQVIIDSAPLLERLIPDGRSCCLQIRIIQAPKLKILRYSDDGIPAATIMVFKEMELLSLTNAMRTVKILALNTVPTLDVVINLLQCFPCVEKLHIMVFTRGRFRNAPRYVSHECLDAHLKVVQLTLYRGKRSEVNLVRFFLLNARMLESMKFIVDRAKCDDDWIASQHKKLQLDIRASQGARFAFEPQRQTFSCVPMEQIHNLELDDPFDRSRTYRYDFSWL